MAACTCGWSVFTRPPEQLADAGQLLDERHAELVLLDVRGRAAARDQLHAELGEPAREGVEPGLVVDGEQRALDHSLSSRSDLRIQPMLDGVQTLAQHGRRVAVLDGHVLLGDHRARVDAFVHPVDGNAGLGRSRSQRVLDRRRAREGAGSSDGWMLTMRSKRARKAGVSRCM